MQSAEALAPAFAPPDDDTQRQLKEKHPSDELQLLEAQGFNIVVRVPKRPEYERFMARLADEESNKVMELERLVRDHVVHPDPTTVDALLQVRPGLGQTYGNRLLGIAGLQKSATAKKL